MKQFAANRCPTGLAFNKARLACLCHRAGGELENVQFFLGSPPGNDSNALNDDIEVELKGS